MTPEPKMMLAWNFDQRINITYEKWYNNSEIFGEEITLSMIKVMSCLKAQHLELAIGEYNFSLSHAIFKQNYGAAMWLPFETTLTTANAFLQEKTSDW